MNATLRALNRPLLPGARVYLVGGCVRDLLLGRPIRDLDLVTDGNPRRLASMVARRTGGAPFLMHAELRAYRIAPRGSTDAPWVDVLPLTESIEEDLRQRDFTINAMALPVPFDAGNLEQSLVDPCGGLADLHARRLRHTHPDIFTADPVRLLRAVRIAAALEFTLDPETEALVRRDAALLPQSAVERIRDELFALLEVPGSATWVRRMETLGLLAPILPETVALKGLTQNANHHLDVWEHTLEAMRQCEALLIGPELPEDLRAAVAEQLRQPICAPRSRLALLLFSVLLHDIAKPQTRGETPEGIITFARHDVVGAEMAGAICRRYRPSKRETKRVVTAVGSHLRPGFLSVHEPVAARQRYHFFRDMGDATVESLLLSLADRLAARGPWATDAQVERHRRFVEEMLRLSLEGATVAHPVVPIGGRELAEAVGCPQGPLLGDLLDALKEAVAVGEVSTRGEAILFARGWLSSRRKRQESEAPPARGQSDAV
ncbi:MAG: CCA tRNA nucleotidyltransferase [Armatimonadetes bacterium]|nr:CCA tRNA nucleotidyltransferase [Armatimonadota bacterium]